MKPPIPYNEADRLRTLKLYGVLDTAAEKCFDDLTQLASTICEAPICLVSLIDETRQWFKSRVGIDATETPRDFAFCAHAINQSDMFVIEDALKDERFANNPLVTSDPGIRFYAGVPLFVTEGQALGTLCVIDRIPRHLTAKQIECLTTLGSAVVSQLELRRALSDLRLLQEFVPMCAWCRSIRLADSTWRPLHEYVAEVVKVTHGMCPACRNSAVSGVKSR